MNEKLNTNELILLDNIVYLDSDPKFSNGGYKICDIIEHLKSKDGLEANVKYIYIHEIRKNYNQNDE